MTETQLRNTYVNMAKSYLGSNEGGAKHKEIVDTYNTISPLPVGYRLQYDDEWCAGFVSAMAQLCGYTDFILPECSCTRMIALYVASDRWEESDSYQPKPGDIIMYDWENGQNDADHTGIVVSCDGSTITVIEGNKSNTVEYREIAVGGDFIRGFCLPDYASKASSGVDTSTPEGIQQYVYDFLYDKGLPHISICAVMGNITGESSWNPDAIENGSGIGFGLCQWSYGRRDQLEAYGTSLYHQCEFLWSELTGQNTNTTGADFQWISNPADSVDNGEGFTFSNSDFIQGNGTLDVLTKAFCYCWERPAYETNHLTSTRIPSANEFYSTMSYNGSGGTDPEEPEEPVIPPWQPSTRKKMSLLMLVLATRRRR